MLGAQNGAQCLLEGIQEVIQARGFVRDVLGCWRKEVTGYRLGSLELVSHPANSDRCDPQHGGGFSMGQAFDGEEVTVGMAELKPNMVRNALNVFNIFMRLIYGIFLF